jgi:hypothetical protein
MFPFGLCLFKTPVDFSKNKTSNIATFTTTNQWVSVLNEDVMAEALAAVRTHRLQKQSVKPETHAQEATTSFRKERQCNTTAVRALPSEKSTRSESTRSELVPSRSAVELPAELPPQAIGVRRPSMQPDRSNTATRVFSTVTAQAQRYNTVTAQPVTAQAQRYNTVTAQPERSGTTTRVFYAVTAQWNQQ